MPLEPLDPSKELRLMLAFFGEASLPACVEVPPAAVPEPYRSLLVHNHHMTVTLERHHGGPVDVRAYRVQHSGEMYGRKLDLVVRETGRVAMTGVMLFNLATVDPAVRRRIVEAQAPLGHILIRAGVMREISTETTLRIAGSDPLVARFGLAEPVDCYGRLATIFFDGRPAVDLLEILHP